MALTKNASLVRQAEQRRQVQLSEAVATLSKSIALEDASGFLRTYGPWTQELSYVNEHITVPEDQVKVAVSAYHAAAKLLVKQLEWPDDAIEVIPQGSASTQTLIRSPDRSKFDIDAVCAVDITRTTARDPVGFFNAVGNALRSLEPTPKKRCWNINYVGEPFYLEFTPSVPLDKVSVTAQASMSRHFRPVEEYRRTALAVVDNPTEQWKTSNPAGFTKWVNDIAQISLLRHTALEAYDSMRKSASIAPVPHQDVEITDTLRVAIRLFKRHRDMSVHRGHIESDFKPISIVIVTLLTACYAGLSELGRTYHHPVELLADLAELMPGMVLELNGEYRVDNPTVEGENFAERWNQDNGERHHAFVTWCDILSADLRTILAASEPEEIRRQVRSIFGCNGDTTSPAGPTNTGGNMTTRRPPAAPPRTTGLA